jgi:hypothetical protein
MYMSQVLVGNKAPSGNITISMCPYKEEQGRNCSASITKMPIDQRRKTTYCATEDFDCCPVFLGKVLRGN